MTINKRALTSAFTKIKSVAVDEVPHALLTRKEATALDQAFDLLVDGIELSKIKSKVNKKA